MMLPATANWEEREGKRDGSDWGEDLNWEVVRQLRTGAWPKNQRSGRGADWRWREMGGSGNQQVHEDEGDDSPVHPCRRSGCEP